MNGYEAVTTRSKRTRHHGVNMRDRRFAEDGRYGATLCTGDRAFNRAALAADAPPSWRRIPDIADMPMCKQCVRKAG